MIQERNPESYMIHKNYTEISLVSAPPRRTQTHLVQNDHSMLPLDTPQTRALSAIPSHKLMVKNASATVRDARYRPNMTCCVCRKGWRVGQRRKRGVNASDRIRGITGEFVGLGRLQRDDDLWCADTLPCPGTRDSSSSIVQRPQSDASRTMTIAHEKGAQTPQPQTRT